MLSDLTSASPEIESILAGVDVDVQREREDGEGGEEDEGVHEDGLAVGVEADEVDVAVGARELAEQARGQQHEEHHAHHHGAPVRHAYQITGAAEKESGSVETGNGEETRSAGWFMDARRRDGKVASGEE